MDLSRRIINNKYKITERIAEGRISTLYRAYEISNENKPVAIKILKNNCISHRIEDIIRFRSEVEKLAGIQHENLLQIYEFGEVIGLHYIAMEYMAGKSLAELLAEGEIPLKKSIDIITGICRGIELTHKMGIIHRDLKPENIIITANTNIVKIIDFGLARIKEYNEIVETGEISAIFGYIAPEQSGILKRNIDERSDLYSLGVLFYRLLTGKLPFTGTDICTIMHQQIAHSPDAPGTVNPEVPEILDKIILKLLEKEPHNRYQGTGGLLSDLGKYTKGQTDFIPGLNDRFLNRGYRTRLVGRTKELDALKELFHRTRQDKGGACFISGETGAGKSRLIEEFRDYVCLNEGLLIEGSCFASGHTTPYLPFKVLLDSYLKQYATYSDSRQEEISKQLWKEFKELGEIIIRLNPMMKKILGVCRELPPLHPNKETNRFHMVIERFFTRLSELEKGLIIVIEDLHWSDPGSINLLNGLIENIKTLPLVIAGTYNKRTLSHEDILNLHTGDQFVRELDLDLPNRDETNTFIAGLLQEEETNTRELSHFIFKKSKGNPFFTIEIIKQLIEEKALLYKDSSWKIASPVLESIDVPSSITDIILKRIELLEAQEKEILSYAAVIGKEFDLQLLFSLSDSGAEEIVAIVDKAIDLQLLEAGPLEKNTIRFFHDRVKEVFYNYTGELQKRELHRSIAYTIEKINKDSIGSVVFDLAWHFYEAGEKEKSIEYVYPAGLQSKENFSNEEAVRFFTKTLELLEETSPEKRKNGQLKIDCRGELAGIYLRTGNYDEAITILNEILPLSTDGIARAKIFRQLSEICYRKGELTNCEEYAARGLALLGKKLPRTKFRVITSLGKELVRHIFHQVFSGIIIRPKEKPRAEEYRLLITFYESLMRMYSLYDFSKLAHSILQGLNYFESRFGISEELAVGYIAYASMCMSVPLFNRARKFHEKGLVLNRTLNSRPGIAKSCHYLGFFHEWTGDFALGAEYLNKSLDLHSKLGDIKEVTMTLNGLVDCHYYRGSYSEALSLNKRNSEMACRARDDYAIATADSGFAKIYRESGDLEKANMHAGNANRLSLEKEIWFCFCQSLIESGCNALEQGCPEKAVMYLEEAKELNEKNSFLKQYTVAVYFNLARAYIEEYLLKEQELPGKKRALYIKKIKEASFLALKKTKKWAAHLGGALRVMGSYYALIGSNDRAKKFFQLSIDHCLKTGREFERARSLYQYGLFLTQVGERELSKKKFETAYQVFCEIAAMLYIERVGKLLGIKEQEIDSTSIQRLLDKERTSSINRLSRKISMIPDIDQLLNEVISEATLLTGAQRGYLFIIDQKSGELIIEAKKDLLGPGKDEYSSEIVEKVLETGKYCILPNEESSYMGSVLCIPIKSRYRVMGACYFSNPLSSGVFTEQNADLLLTFLSQAAEAIENAFLHRDSKSGKESQLVMTPATEAKIKKAMAFLNENYQSEISREGLAAFLDMHPDNLGRFFKIYTGKKIKEYINELRVKEAALKLREQDDSIINIALASGFESLRTFNRAFLKIMSVSPKKYRDGEP
ncbi:MAG: protein kinase [bacterium]|nr:protein kinase [bacterium]